MNFFKRTIPNSLLLALWIPVCAFLPSNLAMGTGDEADATSSTQKVNRELSRTVGSYYLENGKFNEAIQYLSNHLQDDPNDAEAWRTLGLVNFRIKNWKDASIAFKKAIHLTHGTERGTNLYYLANSQNMANDTEGTQKTLDDLKKLAGFSKAVMTVQEHISNKKPFPKLEIDKEEIAAKQARAGTRLAFNFTVGHDSNVLLLADPSIIPGVTTTSWFYKPSAQLQHPFTLMGESVIFQGSSVYTRNLSKDAQIFDNVSASIGLDYRLSNPSAANLGLAMYISEDLTWVNLHGMKLLSYSEIVGIRGTPFKGKEWSVNFNVPINFVKYPNPENPDSTFNADGVVLTPSISHRHTFLSTSFTETLNFGKQFAKGSNSQFNSIGGTLGALKEIIPYRLSAEANVNFNRAVYPSSNPGRTDQTSSEDINLNFTAQEIKSVFRLSAAHAQNISTIPTGNYKKYVFSLGVTYEAF